MKIIVVLLTVALYLTSATTAHAWVERCATISITHGSVTLSTVECYDVTDTDDDMVDNWSHVS